MPCLCSASGNTQVDMSRGLLSERLHFTAKIVIELKLSCFVKSLDDMEGPKNTYMIHHTFYRRNSPPKSAEDFHHISKNTRYKA